MSKEEKKDNVVSLKKDTPLKYSSEVLEAILAGKEQPPNDTIKYLVEQLSFARNQTQQLIPEIEKREAELNNMRVAVNELGIRFKTLQIDIRNLWPKEENPVEEEKNN